MRYAIILTHNRPRLLVECVAAISPQVDVTLVIDNASHPPVDPGSLSATVEHPVAVAHVPDQPPNLAHLWNRGLDMVNQLAAGQPWHAAVLCDDAIAPPGWFAAVTQAMDETGAVIGYSNPWGHQHPPQVKTQPDADIMGRMPGWAFILNGASGLRADETMHWWWLDTDLDRRARQAGGVVMIGGYPVPNSQPNHYTNIHPHLAEQAGRDRARFAEIWGKVPW